MQELTRGQKGKLGDLGVGDTVEIAIDVSGRSSGSLDISCFGLDSDGKLSDENGLRSSAAVPSRSSGFEWRRSPVGPPCDSFPKMEKSQVCDLGFCRGAEGT